MTTRFTMITGWAAMAIASASMADIVPVCSFDSDSTPTFKSVPAEAVSAAVFDNTAETTSATGACWCEAESEWIAQTAFESIRQGASSSGAIAVPADARWTWKANGAQPARRVGISRDKVGELISAGTPGDERADDADVRAPTVLAGLGLLAIGKFRKPKQA
ncbi:MAG: hypothetical protein H6810_07445 [Phycisphaeraceae bacterium]|nr:MAG: hypothetical protein H6810_07445 [Phycisphaeraceae bacterium]